MKLPSFCYRVNCLRAADSALESNQDPITVKGRSEHMCWIQTSQRSLP
jgi:hypothetical protein